MIDQISDIEDLAGVRSTWDALYRTSGVDNVFLTATWIEIWMRWFSNNEHVVLLNRVGDQLVSAGVFHRDPKGCSYISTEHSYWPGILSGPGFKPLVRPYLDHMWTEKRGGRILLNGVPEAVDFWTQLTQEVSDRYYLIRRDPHCTRSIELKETMAAYLGNRPSNVRSELHRKQRKIEKTLPGVCVSSYDALSDIDDVFHNIREVERDSWKFEAGTAIVCSPKETGFYRGILSFDDLDIRGRAFFLEHDKTPLAFVIGVVHKQRFYALKTSYKKQFASLSPGQVLFYRLIETFFKEGGVREIELLGSDSRWKRELATNERHFVNIELLEKSLSSSLYVFARQYIRPFLRNIVKKYPSVAVQKNKAETP